MPNNYPSNRQFNPGGQHNRPGGQPNQPDRARPDMETIRKIIDGDTDLLVQKAEEIGRELKNKDLKTAQIRNIYGTVKKYEGQKFSAEKTVSELTLLKPRLAYAAARERSVELLRDVLCDGIDAVRGKRSEDSFKNFCKFFEAILAYYKAAGGK